ncbi:MAG: ATP-binding protein [Lachnospiraceae bacterium]|nr:ATP-binding protein [Lachnospiraceae bacterium]
MIQRERYINNIKPFIGKDIVKVLTGIRRSGKSVMLRLIQEEIQRQGVVETQFISFNFESMENADFCTASSLYQELKRRIALIQGKVYLFFDEIQEVEQWEKCINSARVDFDCDIYITGSNAKLLSGELASYLGGRYVEFVVFPFSFEEYLESIKQENKDTSVTEEFKNYLEMGGMPFLVNLRYDKEASLQYLRDVYNSVLLKDVVQRNNIRDVELLERMILYFLDNVGHSFSARSISNYLKQENRKVSAETILNYIKACCDAYLFMKLRREDLQGKKILSVNEKYYSVDHGLREAILGTNTRNIDQVLENIVCVELLRRGYTVTIGKNGEKEIDFIAKKNKDKLYIQVAYLLAGSETIEREFGIYDSVRDHYPKYVLSLDELDMSRNGIKHLNIRDFLLSKEY